MSITVSVACLPDRTEAVVSVFSKQPTYHFTMPKDNFHDVSPHKALLAIARFDTRVASQVSVMLAGIRDTQHDVWAKLRIARNQDDLISEEPKSVCCMAYRFASGTLTTDEVEAELRRVHALVNPHYGVPGYDQDDFETMVAEFAGDNFYRYHLLAIDYLSARKAEVDATPTRRL